MRGDDHYAVLGLRPGAGRAQVEEAYRRLIKLHHPDRMGGDGGRAAEINRAYTQIRRGLPEPPPQRRSVPVPIRPADRRVERRTALAATGLLLAAGAALVAMNLPRGTQIDLDTLSLPWDGPVRGPAGLVSALAPVDFDEPLHADLVDRSIADAMKLYEAGDRSATLDFSRSCHNQLRDQPSLAWFDSCAAFDEAMALLESGNALAEGGPFSSSAVVARHIAAARLLTRDILAADSRLQAVRSRVEMAVIPRMDEAASAELRSST